MTTILRREALTSSTFLWEVDAPDVARAARAGQFVIVRTREGAERIPLTVADMDPDRGSITLVVQPLGRSTIEMRDRYGAGDEIADLVGPLGQPQRIEQVGHVVLVGGGLGVAPVLPQLRAFHEAGNRTTAIVGFRDASLVFWEERLAHWSDRLVLCTDDGSRGRAGFVTAALADVLAQDRPDLVVAIGPMAMMRACAEITRPFGVRTVVSLNTIMVDGTGMCGSCRVTIDGSVRFACVDGPDFDAHHVDFDELLARQGRFRAEEQAAIGTYEHLCSLEQQLFVEGKHAYKRIRDLEPVQVPMPQRDPASRVQGFDEVNLGYSLTEALREAERCIQCARPTCIAGCPVEVDIPRFIRHLLVNDVDGALAVIQENNVLPSVCGRVCPQESQCEAQCVIGRKVEPVAIGRLERFVGDHAHAHSPVPPDEPEVETPPAPTLGRVAVVGSGPAGLACAADLARAGARVVVMEALHVAGGVLRYGIPSFRLPREIIDREVERLVALGVEIRTDTVIGRTFTVEQLLGEMGFDAVFLGVGAGAPSFLGIPGEGAGRVLSANELLTRVNLMGPDAARLADTPSGIGDSVAVVGAGNTAMDCLRVARRLGASTVRCVYRRSRAEAPARVEELRHAEEEGIEFLFLHAPEAVLVDDQGGVRGLLLRRMELGEPDERGRRRPVPTDDTFELACDTVVEALGTNANPIVTRTTAGLELDQRGYIRADPVTQATSLPGVFAGGDIVTGGATVILAMGAGRRAAHAIIEYLGERRSAGAPLASLRHAAACPRCGDPIEDGESPYVCCAGEVLTWRCTECAKVSEGFAQPYGRCMACGGRLERTGATPVDDTTGVEAVRAAFEIELGGRAFYRSAAADASDAELAALFGRLAEMEDEHLATLVRRYHLPAPDAPTGDALVRAALTTGIEQVPGDPANLFRIAIALEHRAVELFSGRAADATPAVAALYDELAAEEREHVDLLTTAYGRWRRGEPVFL
jgi:homotetrameric NADPH-dependent glutamate synthase